MTAADFNTLPLPKKETLLWQTGQFIDSVADYEKVMHLFYLQSSRRYKQLGFYVEITIDTFLNKVTAVDAVTTYTAFDKYLPNICLKDLI